LLQQNTKNDQVSTSKIKTTSKINTTSKIHTTSKINTTENYAEIIPQKEAIGIRFFHQDEEKLQKIIKTKRNSSG